MPLEMTLGAMANAVLRPPLAQDRIEWAGSAFATRFDGGTTAIDLDPLSFLIRLAASVPAPRFNTIRYSGVLAPSSKWRSAIVPPRADDDEEANHEQKPTARRSGGRLWQELLKRSFVIIPRTPARDPTAPRFRVAPARTSLGSSRVGNRAQNVLPICDAVCTTPVAGSVTKTRT